MGFPEALRAGEAGGGTTLADKTMQVG